MPDSLFRHCSVSAGGSEIIGTTTTKPAFAEEDWARVIESAYPVMAAVQDIAHHRLGDGWDPWATPGDTAALISEVREILEQLEAPIKAARTELARVELAARLRAGRRHQQLGQASTEGSTP